MTDTRVFFTCDVHGSETTFLKLTRTNEFYKAGVLILAGDITGKSIVPVIEQNDGSYKAKLFGTECHVRNEIEISSLEKKILIVVINLRGKLLTYHIL